MKKFKKIITHIVTEASFEFGLLVSDLGLLTTKLSDSTYSQQKKEFLRASNT